jgi:hypothetical protein
MSFTFKLAKTLMIREEMHRIHADIRNVSPDEEPTSQLIIGRLDSALRI